ncbi:hypothetical protein NEOLEDRAFT_1128556 [Neolentinus lepideus HHB14362 ss-1]|uniref:Uncharacterized protein n=1 Tax=Neolentinus lepideus HHB14362 ss-1 TaxID=1314782 RepID=A0A165V234_9AGAM|nr:hypothetical protein NEOLEDRAFT_1128556 [Neolentinus lepideus HHB14362 ss-1]
MADIQPPALPRFLDPILDYLADTLPGPLYSLLETVLAHLIALSTSLFSLIYALVTSNPSEWDIQTILPPLITLLAAYLALISLYRTTSWMVRSSLWMVKWATILGAVFSGIGWVMGNNAAGGAGITSAIGGILLDLLNGPGQNAAGGTRRQTRSQSRQRPKLWDSFDRHFEWQYQENQDDEEGGGEVQKIVKDILGAAGTALREGAWWETLKGMMEPVTEEDSEEGQTPRRRQSNRRAKRNEDPVVS